MIAVFGAGSIGCHVGGALAAAGAPVTLIGRPRVVAALAEGFQVRPLEGAPVDVPPGAFAATTDPGALAAASIVLVCVKSGDTADAAEAIAAHAPADAIVVSLQNGLANPAVLAHRLGTERVVRGMVAYNVVRPAPNRFDQATEGAVMVGPVGAPLIDRLDASVVAGETREDIEAIQWSKLLMNLNNALCLLSGLPLRDELAARPWRRVLAACVAEGVAVAKAEGQPLARLGKVRPQIVPFVLRLPDPLFARAAAAMLRVDPAARTSMVEDYENGRSSEIDWLNGFIADRAAALDVPAPVNARVAAAARAAFADPARPPLSADPKAFLV